MHGGIDADLAAGGVSRMQDGGPEGGGKKRQLDAGLGENGRCGGLLAATLWGGD